jgi:signal transduction histidine kinase
VSHPDQIDPGSRASAAASDRSAVSWPLVERRQEQRSAPPGASISTPLWPFRLLALAGAVLLSWSGLHDANPRVIAGLAASALGTLALISRPTLYSGPHTIRRVLAEFAAYTLVVMLTGAWPSPFAIMLIPSAMLAGFALGPRGALTLTGATSVIVSAQHLAQTTVGEGIERSLLWAGLLALVAFTCGLAQQATVAASRQREQAMARVSQLAEANALLFALQRLAQTLPASLDLDDVVGSTLQRVRALVPADAMAVYLADDADGRLERYRAEGDALPATIELASAPPSVRASLDAPRTSLLGRLDPGSGLAPDSGSAVYAALRARGTVVGLLVLESHEPGIHDQQDAEVVHGLAEPFGIAIDNARLFRRIRVASADEERSRIARDLHDRVGSSLAFLGFEIDRAQQLAANGDEIGPVLDELRSHLTEVVRDVRETLHDLRSDVSEQRSLAEALRTHLDRVEERGGLSTRLVVDGTERLPAGTERELWRLALEAITNVERHAAASEVSVRLHVEPTRALLTVSDNGVGLNPSGIAADRYGMIGMRERAAAIGAVIRFESAPGTGTGTGTGTTVTVSLDRDPMADS